MFCLNIDPHLQVIMNVENYHDAVQKTEFQGHTVSPTTATRSDLAAHSFEKNGYLNTSSPGLDNKMILTTSTYPYKTNTIHPVLLDLKGGKAKVVPLPNKYTAPKKNFGTMD